MTAYHRAVEATCWLTSSFFNDIIRTLVLTRGWSRFATRGVLKSYEVRQAGKHLIIDLVPTCDFAVIDFQKLLTNNFPAARFSASLLQSPGTSLTGLRITYVEDYRYRIFATGRVPDQANIGALLEIWSRGVVIADQLDESVSLDFYTVPQDETEFPQYPRTLIGELINRAKYHGDEESANDLARRVKDIVSNYPRLREADYMAIVPSTDPTKALNLAEWVGTSVARELGKKLLRVGRTRSVNPQKGIGDDLAELQSNVDRSMRLAVRLSLEDVIVFDDVYRSGATLNELGRACRAAGAAMVIGLTMAKTAKFSRSVDYSGRQ